MMTQILGLAKVLAQTTVLQTLFGAADAAAVLSTNTFYGTAQGSATALPANYAVYSLEGGSNFQSLSMQSDCYIRYPRIALTLYVSGYADTPTPQEAYQYALLVYEALCEEIFASFVGSPAIYESDGTGRIAITELIFDQDGIDLGERSAEAEYTTTTIIFVLSPE